MTDSADSDQGETLDKIISNKRLNTEEQDAGELSLRSRPYFAWIAIGGRCNLDCAHCGIPPRDKRDPDIPELSRSVFEMLKCDLFPYLETCAFGGNNVGEQLLASAWDHYFEEMDQFRFRLILVTNGVLLNRERIAKLVARGAQINLSLEGVTRPTYESIRGPFYDRLISNLQLLKEERRRQPGTGAVVHLGFTVCYDNVRELAQLMEFAARYEVDEVSAHHFVPWYEYQRSQSLVYHKTLGNEWFARAVRRSEELGIRVYLEQPFQIESLAPRRPGAVPSRAPCPDPCFLPWTSVSINEWGLVHPCCGSDMRMGDLNTQEFEEVWNGDRYRRLRSTVNSKQPFPACAACVQRMLFSSSAAKEANLMRYIGGIGAPRALPGPAHFEGFGPLVRAAARLEGQGGKLRRRFTTWIHRRGS